MLHVTRWRTVVTTALSAVVAAGAFGLDASLNGPETPPEPIRLEWRPDGIGHGDTSRQVAPTPASGDGAEPRAGRPAGDGTAASLAPVVDPPTEHVAIVAPSSPVVEQDSPESPSSVASASSIDS